MMRDVPLLSCPMNSEQLRTMTALKKSGGYSSLVSKITTRGDWRTRFPIRAVFPQRVAPRQKTVSLGGPDENNSICRDAFKYREKLPDLGMVWGEETKVSQLSFR